MGRKKRMKKPSKIEMKPKFKKGEVVWFHPEPTLDPKRKEKRTILEVDVTKYGVTYRTLPIEKTLFPTFNYESQFSKIE